MRGTAVAEYYQGLPKPGTLVPYHLDAGAIADLTTAEPRDTRTAEALAANWNAIAWLDRRTPPSWGLADELIAGGGRRACAICPESRWLEPGAVAMV